MGPDLLFLAAVGWSMVSTARATQADCQSTQGAENYMGHVTTTVSGLTCQRWDAQSPHQHDSYQSSFDFPDSFLSDAANYCRNPKGEESGPWCYTTDPGQRWEYCRVPVCGRSGPDCLTTAQDPDYMGHQTTTTSGLQCQRWDSQSPHQHDSYQSSFDFPDSFLSDAANYCRNPKGEESGPWCYTTEPGQRWEFCDVFMCTAAPVLFCPNRVFAHPGHTDISFSCSVLSQQPLEGVRISADGHPGLASIQYQVVDPVHYSLTVSISHVTAQHPSTYTLLFSNDAGPTTASIQVALSPTGGQPDCRPGGGYIGTNSTTVSGRMCQRWDSQAPHPHTAYNSGSEFVDGSLDGAAGYCRAPAEGSTKPWCYTMDPNREWEHCDVPSC